MFTAWKVLWPLRGANRSTIIKFQLHSQFQIFLYQTLCVFSQMKDIKHIRRCFSFRCLGHAPEVGLGGVYGVRRFKKSLFPKFHQRGSYMVLEIDMGVCPRLEFYNIMFINCLGYDFYILMVHLSFYAIPLLIYDVMYNTTTLP